MAGSGRGLGRATPELARDARKEVALSRIGGQIAEYAGRPGQSRIGTGHCAECEKFDAEHPMSILWSA